MNSTDGSASRRIILLLALLIPLALTVPPLVAGEILVTAEVAKLIAPDGDIGDELGWAVSLDGDRLAVGAHRTDDNVLNSGSAYIFERDIGGDWLPVTKILPLDGQPLDQFGGSVSLDGNRLAVGAIGDDDNGANSGSVYLFERNANGSWSQATKILPRDGAPGDRFGGSLSLAGDRLTIGASDDNDNGVDSGSAYVFERDADGSWLQVTKIVPLDAEAGDRFGTSVSLDGERLAVGAWFDDDNGSQSGSAYIFEHEGVGEWSQVAKMVPLDGEPANRFGEPVSLDGDRLAVGVRDDNDNGLDSGSAYVFEQDVDGDWAQVAKLLALGGEAGDQFGHSVSLDGDQLAIGANEDNDNGPRSGSAYVFERDAGGNWSQVQEIRPLDGQLSDHFGGSVSLDQGRLALGANGDDDNGSASGSAYIFEPVLVSPQLAIRGTCPGQIEITRTGTTPRSGIELYTAASEGSFSLSDGPCEGTTLDLDAPDLLGGRNGEFNPERTIVRTVDELWCGRYVQMLDEKTCLTSEVARVP